MKQNTKIWILTLFYIGSLLLANYLSGLTTFDFFGHTLSLGILVFPITFLFTDIIGYFDIKKARKAMYIGMISNVILLFLGVPIRIIIASLSAFIFSQSWDIFIFHKLKGKKLWIRNNLSTMTSQIIDTGIFMMIAFYGVFPIIPAMIAQYLFKIGYAMLDTPICYLGVKWVRE